MNPLNLWGGIEIGILKMRKNRVFEGSNFQTTREQSRERPGRTRDVRGGGCSGFEWPPSVSANNEDFQHGNVSLYPLDELRPSYG